MSWGLVAVAGATVASSAYSGKQQRKAAAGAAGAQVEASDASIEEQRRQFDAMTEVLSPYVESGENALQMQQDFLGLSGPGAEQQAIRGIEQGPQFGAMVQQGEEAILQNAAATGGLRGGNTQAALAQFRPQILSDLINQRFSQLGGLSSMGQSSAAMQGAQGMQLGQNVGAQYTQQGAARAGESIARGRAGSQMSGAIGQLGGMYLGSKF